MAQTGVKIVENMGLIMFHPLSVIRGFLYVKRKIGKKMITLKTITTIELASTCNLACRYCINRLLMKTPERKPGIMSDEIFDNACELLQELVKRGTQQEINLNGNGESCLDPNLADRAKRIKEIVGDRQVGLSTNGVNMTARLAALLAVSGIDRVDLSLHSPFHARRAYHFMLEAGIKGSLNIGAIQATHNWAGQLEPENSVKLWISLPCVPLMEGRGYIQSEGQISPCCYDYRNLGVFGTVFDEDILERPIRPYALCRTCHQKIPNDLMMEFINQGNYENHDHQQHRSIGEV